MDTFRSWLINNKSHSIEITEQSINLLLDRLRPYIEEYKDLAEIDDWYLVRKDREITARLQNAYNIMHDMFLPKGIRCEPCEIEGLLAIRELAGKKFSPSRIINIDGKKARYQIEKYYNNEHG